MLFHFHAPLGQTAFDLAAGFPEAKTRVLAAFAVDQYCQFLGMETDFNPNRGDRFLFDTLPVTIKHLGVVECLPITPDSDTVTIPRDAWENRIGYLGVEIDEKERQAIVSKFLPPIHPDHLVEEVRKSEMSSLEDFLDHLERLEQGIAALGQMDLSQLELEPSDLPKIVTQLERIERTYEADLWRYAGGDLLSNFWQTGEIVEEGRSLDGREILHAEEKDFSDLAEKILNQLSDVWQTEQSDPQFVTAINTAINSWRENVQIKLADWFKDAQNILDAGWQTIEEYQRTYPDRGLVMAMRSRHCLPQGKIDKLTGIKVIDLGEQQVKVIANIEQDIDKDTDIFLQVAPLEADYLLPNVKLKVLDESAKEDEPFLEATSRDKDNWIQVRFRGPLEEKFSIVVQLNDSKFRNNFVI